MRHQISQISFGGGENQIRIDDEALRRMIEGYLAKLSGGCSQVNGVERSTADTLGISYEALTSRDRTRILDVIDDLISDKYLRAGLDNLNQGLPFFRVTEKGKTYFATKDG